MKLKKNATISLLMFSLTGTSVAAIINRVNDVNVLYRSENQKTNQKTTNVISKTSTNFAQSVDVTLYNQDFEYTRLSDIVFNDQNDQTSFCNLIVEAFSKRYAKFLYPNTSYQYYRGIKAAYNPGNMYRLFNYKDPSNNQELKSAIALNISFSDYYIDGKIQTTPTNKWVAFYGFATEKEIKYYDATTDKKYNTKISDISINVSNSADIFVNNVSRNLIEDSIFNYCINISETDQSLPWFNIPYSEAKQKDLFLNNTNIKITDRSFSKGTITLNVSLSYVYLYGDSNHAGFDNQPTNKDVYTLTNNHQSQVVKVTLTGFKAISSETQLSVDSKSIDKTLFPNSNMVKSSDVTDEILDKIFYEGNDPLLLNPYYVKNKKLTSSDRQYEYIFNDSLDSMKVKIILHKYFTQTAGGTISLNQSGTKILEVTLTNFNKVIPTKANGNQFTVTSANFTSQIAYQIDKEEIKNIFEKEITDYTSILTNPPSNFSLNNILDIQIVNAKNGFGTIEFNLIVNNFYDDKGFLVQPENNRTTILGPIKFAGFKPSHETSLPLNFSAGLYKDKKPSSLTKKEIQEILFNATLNPADKAKYSDFYFLNSELVLNDKEGWLEINNLSLSCYNNNQGVLVDQSSGASKKWAKIKITNLSTQNPTTIVQTTDKPIQLQVPEKYKDIPVQDLMIKISTLKEIIFEQKDRVFINLPSDIKSSNIIIDTFNPLYSNGELSFNVSLNKYYDDKGLYFYDTLNPKFFTIIKLTGIISNPITKMPSTSTEIPISDDPQFNIIASDYNSISKQIREKINLSIEGKMPRTSYRNIVIDKEKTKFDNLNGKITIHFSLDRYYDSNGKPCVYTDIDFIPINSSVIFKGFKTVKETKLKTNTYTLEGLSGNLASSIDYNRVKNEIVANSSSIFTDIPFGFSSNDVHWEKGNINYKDEEGIISITDLTLTKYYNALGEIKNDKYIVHNGEFRLDGFRTNKSTKLRTTNIDGSKIPGVEEAYTVNELQIKKAIEREILDAPPGFTYEDIYLVESTISNPNPTIDNRTGTVSVEAYLGYYYDASGLPEGSHGIENLIQPKYLDRITIKNLVPALGATKLKNKKYSLSQDDYYSQFKPSELADWNLLANFLSNNIVQSQIFSNLPREFNVKTDMIRKKEYLKPNDKNGELNILVYVDKSFMQDEKLSFTNEPVFLGNLTIANLQQQSPTDYNPDVVTRILNNLHPYELIDLNNSVVVQNLKRLILENDVIKFAPPNLNYSSIEIIKSTAFNTEGKLSLEINLNNYYDANGIPVSTETGASPKTILVNLTGFVSSRLTEFKDEFYTNDSEPDSPIINLNNFEFFDSSNPNKPNPSQVSVSNIKIPDIKKIIIYLKEDRYDIDDDTMLINQGIFKYNLPSNFSEQDIEILNLNPDASNGSIKIHLKLKNTYKADGFVEPNFKDFGEVLLTGFSNNKQTTVVTNQPLSISNMKFLDPRSNASDLIYGKNIKPYDFLYQYSDIPGIDSTDDRLVEFRSSNNKPTNDIIGYGKGGLARFNEGYNINGTSIDKTLINDHSLNAWKRFKQNIFSKFVLNPVPFGSEFNLDNDFDIQLFYRNPNGHNGVNNATGNMFLRLTLKKFRGFAGNVVSGTLIKDIAVSGFAINYPTHFLVNTKDQVNSIGNWIEKKQAIIDVNDLNVQLAEDVLNKDTSVDDAYMSITEEDKTSLTASYINQDVYNKIIETINDKIKSSKIKQSVNTFLTAEEYKEENMNNQNSEDDFNMNHIDFTPNKPGYLTAVIDKNTNSIDFKIYLCTGVGSKPTKNLETYKGTYRYYDTFGLVRDIRTPSEVTFFNKRPYDISVKLVGFKKAKDLKNASMFTSTQIIIGASAIIALILLCAILLFIKLKKRTYTRV